MSELKKTKNSIIIKPGKDLVASMVSKFSGELKMIIQKSPKEIVIDLEGTEMVDSLGMGVLISTHNAINEKGGKLRVINIKSDIYNALVTMRLNHHFTLEKAGKAVKKPDEA